MEIKLVVLVGEHKGRTIPLPETIVVIGRDPACHIRPRCEWVSRRHCALAAWAGKVRLRDLKSHNGTFLNDRQFEGETAVKDGDKLRVGTMVFGFQIRSSPDDLQVQPVKQGDVAWLLNATQGSGHCTAPEVTKSSSEYDFTDDDLLWQGLAGDNGQRSLAAGEYFRQYLATRGGDAYPPGGK